MRRTAVPAIAALVLALVATACTGGGTASQEMRVSGEFGSQPTIVFPAGKPPADLQVEQRLAGGGAVVRPTDLVIAHYTAHVWDGTGNRLFVSSFQRGAPASFPLRGAVPGLVKALQGRRVGSRVLAAIPPAEGYGPNPPEGMADTDELFYVIDILGTFPVTATAQGTGGPGDLDGVRFTGGPGERPEIALVPGGKPPARTSSKILVRGAGPRTQTGQLLVTQYEGKVWGGELFDSTWADKEPKSFQIGNGSVIPGWDRALVGVPVGSRVALVVTPGYGYGDRGLPPLIKGGATLVFVVDVLGAF